MMGKATAVQSTAKQKTFLNCQGTTLAVYYTTTFSHLMKSYRILIIKPELPVTNPFLGKKW